MHQQDINVDFYTYYKQTKSRAYIAKLPKHMQPYVTFIERGPARTSNNRQSYRAELTHAGQTRTIRADTWAELKKAIKTAVGNPFGVSTYNVED